jgi:ferredoxin-NADP reductase
MRAHIKNKQPVARDTIQTDLELPEDINFFPGQSAQITFMELQGKDKRGRRRFFSIASPPSKKRLIQFVTRLRDSGFKKTLAQLPLGSEVEVTDIGGVFVLPENDPRPLVFIAGGIGITPFLSMLRHLNERGFDRQVTLLFSNRDRESTIFLDELSDIALRHPQFRLVATMTQDPNWPGEKRKITPQFIQENVPDYPSSVFMMAGPQGMVNAMFEAVSGLGVEISQIMTEEFTGY